jgi:hypothetical protein
MTDYFSRAGSLEELQAMNPGADWMGLPRVELEPDAVLRACAPEVFLDSYLAFEIFILPSRIRGVGRVGEN